MKSCSVSYLSKKFWRDALLGLACAGAAAGQAGGGLDAGRMVELALSRNAELLAARQQLAEAQAQLRQAGLRPNPAIDVLVSNGDMLGSAGERELSVGYSHVFELGNKRGRRVDLAQLGADLARQEIANRERLLRAEVKSRYAEALAALRNLENAEQLLTLTRQSYQLARARAREGEGSPLEQGLLEVEVARIDSDRLLFTSQLQRSVLELKLLTGADFGEDFTPSASAPAMAGVPEESRAVETALASRPDLAAARIAEALSAAELRLARAGAVPDLVATGRYSYSESRFDQYGFARPGGALALLRDRDSVLAAGVSVTLPLRNRNQGNIEAAAARLRAARLRLEFAEKSVRQEVFAALNRYQAARQALDMFDRGVLQQSQENLRIVRGAYQLGELRLLDVIAEQRRLLDTQRAYADLQRLAYVAAAELERALGAPVN